MLTILGNRTRFCDGVSRRNFLRIGALAAGGLTMADLLRADARAGTAARAKSIVNIYLPGGPSHMDTFDLKPQAPAEFRGDFAPIATNVPGMEICQHMPRLAQMGDKLAIIRSVSGINDEHSPRQSDTGWPERSLSQSGGRPGIGAVLSKVTGSVHGDVLTSICLSNHTTAGYLGPIYKDYAADGAGRENLKLNGAITADRLSNRKQLLEHFDRMRREADRSGMMAALDSFSQRAVDVVTSGKLAEALDLSKEKPEVLDRYGCGSRGGDYSGANRSFLMARRLIEVGTRVVSLAWGGWDTHGNNFGHLSKQLPAMDVGVAPLVEDLQNRGLLNDTMIMISGEFGRTPRVNSGAGRDRWAPACSYVLIGGGLRTGQVIGSTNRLGERPQDRPVHLQQIFATLYRQLGIDLDTTLIDPNGRPQYLLENREAISELL